MDTDVKPIGTQLYFLPVKTRVPLKFGPETLTHVTCARACMCVKDSSGNTAQGWGETPLSVQWAWPSSLSYEERHQAMKDFTIELARVWSSFYVRGHPMEIGHAFQEDVLGRLLNEFNKKRKDSEQMPYLAALICCSVFDIALHDAYGLLHSVPVYATYNKGYMNYDLAHYLTPVEGTTKVSFADKYPSDFLLSVRQDEMLAWHLVGGMDAIDRSSLTGNEPNDGYPALLEDWIKRDGLKCLKVKLRGNDSVWDYKRLVTVGKIGLENGVLWLTSDFNCTVLDPAYVTDILDKLMNEEPKIYAMILYVEQPFPYELEEHHIDVHSVSSRKPLFMDESAHNWRLIKLGRTLGWTGVALKTCKTQTGAILSLAWAKAHGMNLMVQDLTNPMLAQIPHLLLAAYAGTIMGVETNGMQFYPEASRPEAAVHPDIYRRRDGKVNLSTIKGPGFGYRLQEIKRNLPDVAVSFGTVKFYCCS